VGRGRGDSGHHHPALSSELSPYQASQARGSTRRSAQIYLDLAAENHRALRPDDIRKNRRESPILSHRLTAHDVLFAASVAKFGNATTRSGGDAWSFRPRGHPSGLAAVSVVQSGPLGQESSGPPTRATLCSEPLPSRVYRRQGPATRGSFYWLEIGGRAKTADSTGPPFSLCSSSRAPTTERQRSRVGGRR
jgi:hypothetical protein